MMGEVEKGKIVHTGGARAGDSIVLTKGIAIEGTSILAREATDALTRAGVEQEVIQRARNFLFSPGISVVKDALAACSSVEVHSLHDPTEGGLATGLWKVARAAGVGILLERERVPVLAECQAFCEALGLDPLGLLASGALLVTLPPGEVPGLLAALRESGIEAWEIGRVTRAEEGLRMVTASGSHPLPWFERDELARFLSPS
jgi:hydrogenase maturation factor